MWILGLNAYHGDASACLVRDGVLVAAAEEERFRRVKHWAGFPSEAVRACLAGEGIGIEQVDYVALNRDPSANLFRKALFTLTRRPSLALVRDRLRNRLRIADVRSRIVEHFGPGFRGEVVNVEHHRAHLASAFFVSPFERAAVASVDGFGDFVSTMVGRGEGRMIGVHDRVFFPHSLGLFYLAVTQHLGFPKYGDEYKVMGLAAYGEPEFLDKMRRIVRLEGGGRFRLDLDFFIHHKGGVSMTWEEGPPEMGPVYSDALARLLGPPRGKDEPIDDRHRNVAASAQAMYEEAFFHVLNRLHDRTKEKNLALAGGCAMNSVANGKIYGRTPFERIYVQAAAGDAGGAIGAAFHVWHDVLGKPRSFVMNRADLGPQYANGTIGTVIEKRQGELAAAGCRIEEIGDEAVLLARAAAAISAGKVVGWFQGRMEWGPRALGHRSIVCDPRRSDMKDILNLKIKRRESFRPFAPSILREAVPEYFEADDDVPFMLQVYKIRPEKRPLIPAVTHVDGTGRLQTVTDEANGRYYRLIREFGRRTGIPLVLNTSFNENEPVVNRPEEALDCFLRTKMDVLVLGDTWVERGNGEWVNG